MSWWLKEYSSALLGDPAVLSSRVFHSSYPSRWSFAHPRGIPRGAHNLGPPPAPSGVWNGLRPWSAYWRRDQSSIYRLTSTPLPTIRTDLDCSELYQLARAASGPDFAGPRRSLHPARTLFEDCLLL